MTVFSSLLEPIADGTRLDVDALAALIPTLVPFPTAAHPGGRTRVRLLDGTGDAQHVLTAAPLIVPAGSEIVVVGNADRFDYDTTEIRYHDPVLKGRPRSSRQRSVPAAWWMMLARPMPSMSPSCSAPTCRSDPPG